MPSEPPHPQPYVSDGRFPALRYRDYRLLWMGQGVSVTGSRMQTSAIRWHLYGLTDSPISLGLLGLVNLVPVLFLSLLGGAVADAADRRRVMLITQSVLACTAAVLAALTFAGAVTPLVIYSVAAVNAAAHAFDGPARQSLMPNLVARRHFVNAASLNSISMQVAGIAGPALAGILIWRGLLGAIYAINAVSFLTVIAALLAIRPGAGDRDPTARPEVSVRALLEGLSFVRRTPILVSTIALDFLATFFSSAEALLPVFARDVLKVGPRGYGLLSSAPAVGSLIAGSVMSLRPPSRRHGAAMLWAVAVYGAATVVFGASTNVALTWAALAISGASDTVSTILRQTIRQLITPDHLRGRMTAVNMVFFQGGPQLGNLEAGLAAALVGAPLSVVLGGVACVASVGLIAARSRALRAYEHA